MANFIAVIRRAVDGLGENTPERRVRVYEKARQAIRRQLENISPNTSDDMIQRQLDKLEEAIQEVELEYASALEPEQSTPEVPTPSPPVQPTTLEAEPVEPAQSQAVAPPTPEPAPPLPEQQPRPDIVGTAAEHIPAADPVVHQSAPDPIFSQEADEPVASSPTSGHSPEHVQSEPVVSEEPPALATDDSSATDLPAGIAPAVDEAMDPLEEAARAFEQTTHTVEDVAAPVQAGYGETPPIADHQTEQMDPMDVVAPVSGPETDIPPAYEQQVFDEAAAPTHSPDPELAPDTLPDEMPGEEVAIADNQPPRRSWAGIALGFVLLLVLGAGGFAAWSNRDALSGLFASSDTVEPIPASTEPSPEPISEPETAGADEPSTGSQEAPQQASQVTQDTAQDPEKFTQRLLPDGTEVETELAELASNDQPASGQSVSPKTEPEAQAETDADTATNPGAGDPEVPVVPVAQKMFLYEERLGQEAPTALEGTILWSEVNESPGGDQPAEPAIRGEIKLPDLGLSALMTIRRNADPSLPASHLIEVVFAVPDGFSGGGIESLLRVAMKQTEEDRGDALVAVPAKITEDFFMVALNDFPEAVSSNIELLKSRSWIDIPITYANGRRALVTLEKGASGAAVFDAALADWAARGTTNSQ